MSNFAPADHLHRLMKMVLDSGEASTVAEAEARFRGYRLAVSIDLPAAEDYVHQAALLTIVTLAKRVFLGGVVVDGALDVKLLVGIEPTATTLREAVLALGGSCGALPADLPLVTVGGTATPGTQRLFHVRTACGGWRGGVLPAAHTREIAAGPSNVLTAMAAAGFAVSEAFQHVSGATTAGKRVMGLSLWRLDEPDWLAHDASEPEVRHLPSRLWLIGLGHLGQAYLWALALLPYDEGRGVSCVLQDIDIVTPSTESTSICTDASMIGMKKTRAMAAWGEVRGIRTSLQERLFKDDFQRQPDEPSIALCGLDNQLGRRALDQVGFDVVVEAGLGSGHRDFQTIRLHTLPGRRSASDLWKGHGSPASAAIEDKPAYAALRQSGLDQCGVTLLAGKAVGAPFVGTVAASLVLAEVLRCLHGGTLHQVVDLDLDAIEQRTVLEADATSTRNPGFVSARKV